MSGTQNTDQQIVLLAKASSENGFHNAQATCNFGEYQVLYRKFEADYVPHDRRIGVGFMYDMNDYEHVATLDFNHESYEENGVSAFGLCQNGITVDSWSREARDGNIDGLTLVKPLEIDEDGKEWGHRSMMVGDMIYKPTTGQVYIVANCGWHSAMDRESWEMELSFGWHD
jgi:hypothetical protein